MKALNYDKTIHVVKPQLSICMCGIITTKLFWNDAHMYLKYPGLSKL
jgi:hypothetical protein